MGPGSNSAVRFRVVIPARYASARLPGKPLLDIAGKPMIQHVYERAQLSGAEQVVIATDDERIETAAKRFGADVVLTSPEHRSGTDRLAEVAAHRGFAAGDIIVNVQGDEPLIPPALIRQVAVALEAHRDASVATVCADIRTAAELFDPHVVKVVLDRDGYALYFSRAVIPWDRDAFSVTTEELPPAARHYRHIGLYAYRCGFLRQYVEWPACEIERMESLEQLRALWHGHRIHVSKAVEVPERGVDTEADLQEIRHRLGA